MDIMVLKLSEGHGLFRCHVPTARPPGLEKSPPPHVKLGQSTLAYIIPQAR